VPGTKKLVIVESPAKAKTIAQYLGDGYEVQASVGHIRDLVEPKNLPAELKKGSLGKFSVDVDNGFEPYYVVSDAKKKTVADLKRALKDADELFLATDEDREGEAIAWHLLQVLKPKVPVHRMVFHEITKEAIQRAQGEGLDARARHRARRRAGDPPHPRPPVRLRGLAGALAQGRPRPLRRSRAVRGDATRRRP
jgi:DNA topoisomerase-1